MDIVARATLGFLFVLFVARIVGRRELSSMQPFDLILLVMIGDLVQQGITQNDFSVTGLVLAAGTIAVLTVAVSYGGFKLPWLRPVLEGEPVIVLQDGEPVMKNLDRNRITVDELRAAARLEGIARLADVEWAVLETGGRISFIAKSG
ncbi:MAG TPA: YetF domain-containing protein [Gaiellaceae bacterium]